MFSFVRVAMVIVPLPNNRNPKTVIDVTSLGMSQTDKYSKGTGYIQLLAEHFGFLRVSMM